MKKRLFLIMGLIALLSGCKAHYPTAQQSGKDDLAYLIFVGDKKYDDQKVKVTIDGKKTFDARVVNKKDSKRKGTTYAIATGRKKVQVISGNQVIYNKEIFVSTGETKIITLQ